MSFSKLFNEFLNEPYVISDEGTETKRARDPETKAKIEALYTQSNDKFGCFNADVDSGRFNIIKYEDMEYNTHDVYITHLNETEDFIYRDKSFATSFFNPDELIPKGSIASRPPKNPNSYPILSQTQAEKQKSRAYYQLANIGSCTRYQGSEVTDKQKLYYIITPDSKVTNREWYTVVSRCWTLDSIVIVLADRRREKPLAEFNGKKVKNIMILSVTEGDLHNEQASN